MERLTAFLLIVEQCVYVGGGQYGPIGLYHLVSSSRRHRRTNFRLRLIIGRPRTRLGKGAAIGDGSSEASVGLPL